MATKTSGGFDEVFQLKACGINKAPGRIREGANALIPIKSVNKKTLKVWVDDGTQQSFKSEAEKLKLLYKGQGVDIYIKFTNGEYINLNDL